MIRPKIKILVLPVVVWRKSRERGGGENVFLFHNMPCNITVHNNSNTTN